MRVKKTKQSDRGVYRYPVQVEDGRGGYRTAYNVIKPGEDGITEVMIKSLHAMDDHEVYLNVKNGHPPMTAEQKVAKKEWEVAHPGEKYTMNWNLSLDYIAGEDDEEVETYRIVTSVRGSSLNGLVSIESPLGKALLGHKEGDRVFIKVNDDFGYYVIVKKVIKTQSEDEDHIRSF